MPLQTKIESPDTATTLSLKDAQVTEDITRSVTAVPIPGKHVVSVDVSIAKRVFTIRGKITSKADLEALQVAVVDWAGQAANQGRSRFIWGTKDDSSEKDFRVHITKFTVVSSSETYGGAGKIYDFLLQLVEVGNLSISG